MVIARAETLTTQAETEVTAFAWVDAHHQVLVNLYEQLKTGISPSQVSCYRQLARQIQEVCGDHQAGILAALQLNRNHRYQYVKELFSGVLCELLSKEAGLPVAVRLSLVCAALTQDIAIMELQTCTLDRQAVPLNRMQKELIARHPIASRRMLEQAGVADEIWLTTVAQHHERLDGSGYPIGLKAEEIAFSAKILATVDLYTAMVRPRGDRSEKTPKEAMKKVFLIRGELIDINLAKMLIRILGMHPPGSWVKLSRGEVGVVIGAGQENAFPEVCILFSADGKPLKHHLSRDTSISENTIVEMVEAPVHFDMGAMLRCLWPTIGEVTLVPISQTFHSATGEAVETRLDSGSQNWALSTG